MVMPDNGACRAQKRNTLQHFVAGHGVLPHLRPLFRRKLGGLQENRIGDGNFANIVQQSTLFQ